MTPMIVASRIWPFRTLNMWKPISIAERNRHADRERAPRALGERVDDREAEAGERDDDDEEDGDGGGRAGDRADLGPRDLGQRAAAAPRRRPQEMKSCTAPARHTPATSQMRPGA